MVDNIFDPRIGDAREGEDQPPVIKMLGHGYYSEHSLLQAQVNHHALPMLVEAVNGMDSDHVKSHFVVADYGAAQGANSLEPMSAVVDAVRSRWELPVPISVVHTDLPDNDFSTLLRTIVRSPAGYLRGNENVYSFASPNSIYHQNFPSGYVALGFCAIVVHWLSSTPCNLSNHIIHGRARDEELRQWAQQAARDWDTFLHFRSLELRPSGRLIVIGGEADEKGQFGLEPLLDGANALLSRIVDEGELSDDEFVDMCLPCYCRSDREWIACHDPESNQVTETELSLLHSKSFVFPDPHFEEFCRTADAASFAQSLAEFFRAFSEPSLFASLAGDRTSEERKGLIDSFYLRLQEAIAAEPYKYECSYRYRFMEFEKRS